MPRSSTRRLANRAAACATRQAPRKWRYSMPSCRARSASASLPKWGWRRDRGIVRTSASPLIAFARSSATKLVSASSGVADRPRCGIHSFPSTGMPGTSRCGRGQVHLELLIVLGGRLAGLQLENSDAAVAAMMRQSNVPRRIICDEAGRTENGTSKSDSPESSASDSSGCPQRPRYASRAARTPARRRLLRPFFVCESAARARSAMSCSPPSPASDVPNRSNNRCTSVPVRLRLLVSI